MKKAVKIGAIVIGSAAVISLVGLSIIGLGDIFCAQYHDPEHWMWSIGQSTMYGWDRKFNFGWCA